MTRPLTSLMGQAACLFLALGLGLLTSLLLDGRDGALRGLVRSYLGTLTRDLRFLRIERRATTIATSQAVLLSLLTVVGLLSGAWLWLLPAPLVALGPHHWLQRERAKRVTAIDEQVATFLLALANALRATPSLGEALGAVARLLPAPLNQELSLLLGEYELGTPLDQALTAMAQRIGSKTMRSAVGTLRVARRTGGDLSQTLETSAASLREMARLEGVLRTKTAEGKAQAFLIALLPGPFVGVLQWLSPEVIEPLGQTPTGHLIVAISVLLWLAAILLARKILTVDM